MEDGIPGGLQHRHKTCCEKGGRHGRQACRVQRWHHRRDVVLQTGGLVYDNGTLNKARQISKIVDVVLCYKTYTEGSLFAISSLYKQDLIFSFT